MAESSGPRAGFFARLAAGLIDGVIVIVPYFVFLAATSQGVAYALFVLLNVTYYVALEGGERGQTVGKRALGIRVIDLGGGGSIGYGRALIRWLGRILSWLPLLLGYFWMLWDRERQTWHDKLAQAVVVPTSAYPLVSAPASSRTSS